MTANHVILVRTPSSPLHEDPYHSCLAATTPSSRPAPCPPPHPRPCSPRHLAILDTEYTNLQQLQTIIHTGPRDRYAGVVLTSARSVQAWRRASGSLASDASARPWTSVPFFVVGTGTRDALLSISPPPAATVLGEESGTGDKLARFIADHYAKAAGATTTPLALPLLYLVGDKNRDTINRILGEARIQVDRVQVYQTTIADGFETCLEQILADVLGSEHEEDGAGQEEITVRDTSRLPSVWFALFSPSGAQHCVARLRQRGLLPDPSALEHTRPPFDKIQQLQQRRIKLAAIGPVTQTYLEAQEHLVVHAVAQTPDPQELLRAILECESR